MNLKP